MYWLLSVSLTTWVTPTVAPGPEDPGNECDDQQLQNFTGLTPFDQAEHYHTICPIVDYENQTQVLP